MASGVRGEWVYYFLTDGARLTYTGITNHLQRRIRQHRSEIKGGARYTSQIHKTSNWRILFFLKGFTSSTQVRRFERLSKMPKIKSKAWAIARGAVSLDSLERGSSVVKRLSQVLVLSTTPEFRNVGLVFPEDPLPRVLVHEEFLTKLRSKLELVRPRDFHKPAQ